MTIIDTYNVRPATVKDLDTLYALETANYPPDEAATREKLEYRLMTAPSLFYVLEKIEHASSGTSSSSLSTSSSFSSTSPSTEIIGFICGTLGKGNELQERFMSVGGHDPEGESLCIHSVVIHQPYQRKYLGLFLVQRFLHIQQISILRIPTMKHVHQCLLLAHHDKLRLYEKAGFTSKGPSKVIHGAEQWIELVYPLRTTTSSSTATDSPISNIHVNAFTLFNPSSTQIYSGNPAAVVVLPMYSSTVNRIEDGYPSSEWCQSLAIENNLSETAFLLPRNDGTFTIRWWTPGNEVSLCGHATLASAKVLFAENYAPLIQRTVIFHSRSGTLYATKETLDRIQLNFPREAPSPINTHSNEYSILRTTLCKVFSISTEDILYVGKNAWDIVVEITPLSFRSIEFGKVNFAELSTIDCRGVAITCQGTETLSATNFDPENPPMVCTTVSGEPTGHFVSRWFGPRVAVPEDPVTGSAHCALYPYWETKLVPTFTASNAASISTDSAVSPWLLAYQASPRGGQLWTHRIGDRIYLRGQAQITCTKYLTTNVIQNIITELN